MNQSIAPHPIASEAAATFRSFPLPVSKILILAQDPSAVEALKEIVEHTWEIPVVIATDPEHAMVCFHKMHPDLVVLDHAEAAHFLWQIRQDRSPDVFLPALVLVADEDTNTKKEALIAGATDFLAKPVDTTEAMMRIHNLLSLREARQQASNDSTVSNPRETASCPNLIDRLIQLRSREEFAVRLDRLHAIGTMALGISHDFNNILMVIEGLADQLLQEGPTLSIKDRQDLLRTVISASQDGANIVERLREFHLPSPEDQTYQTVDLNRLVVQAVAFTRPKWYAESRSRGCDITVRQDLSETPSIHGHPTELREILINLIFNAIDAMPKGGTIILRTRSEGHRVVLEVTDTGTGMTDRVRRRCLEPFFTTKGTHSTGMGLPVVHEIVERHRAALEVESEAGKGATFRLRFEGDAPGVSEKSAVSKIGAARLNILVVDDEPMVGELISRFLAAEGHQVRTACDPHDALRDAMGESFDLVITDQSMPLMNGEELAGVLKASCPSTRIMLITGFGTEGFNRTNIDTIVAKPFTRDSLVSGIAEALASPPPLPIHREKTAALAA